MNEFNGTEEYFYDGLEEILMKSINEIDDDERIFNDDDQRISFTREQLFEYQQLMKLLRFVKVNSNLKTK